MSYQPTNQPTNHSPQAWIGDLSAYNAGILRGRWVTMSNEGSVVAHTSIMTRGGNTDYYVADYNNVPRELVSRLGEYPSVADLVAAGELAEEYASEPAFWAWFDNETRDTLEVDELERFYRDEYRGTFDALEDYAYELACDLGTLPADDAPWPLSYIDWQAAARDLELGGAVWTARTSEGLAVFQESY
jgi:antirestriction protein